MSINAYQFIKLPTSANGRASEAEQKKNIETKRTFCFFDMQKRTVRKENKTFLNIFSIHGNDARL